MTGDPMPPLGMPIGPASIGRLSGPNYYTPV